MSEPTNEGGWTDEQTEMLKGLWRDGLSATEIAAAIGDGLSRNAVLSKAHRLKLQQRREARTTGPLGKRPVAATSTGKAEPRPRVDRRFGSRLAFQRQPPKEPAAEPVAFTASTWEAIPGTVPVALMDLNDKSCRWPLGDPFGPPTKLFCGCEVVEGKSYCPEHQKRSEGPGTIREQVAAKEALRAVKHERYVREAA